MVALRPSCLPGHQGVTILSRMGSQAANNASPTAKKSLSVHGTESPAIGGACVLEAEVEGISDTLRRLQRVCFLRCCCRVDTEGRRLNHGTAEPSLQTWELSCSDRCVSKYMQVHDLVGNELSKSVFRSVLEQQRALEHAINSSPFLSA